ncbi:phenylpyruvate tautomerase MIF-related protein [candidate division CSSED10-310 bacterium]|uniref:L-dopachrome isomerase n=1 Tax=candidate division CSSED10-310 bacterium TaxID=2855610 RepID=A0ABV6Z2F5_UNCC1
MPYVKIQTNWDLSGERQRTLSKKLSETVATALGKSQQYVMTALETGVEMNLGGTDDPMVYVEFKSLGLQTSQTGELSHKLCAFFEEEIHVKQDRIYIVFDSPAPALWGWNGKTFG